MSKRHDRQFKSASAKLVLDEEMPVKQISEELGDSEPFAEKTLLCVWWHLPIGRLLNKVDEFLLRVHIQLGIDMLDMAFDRVARNHVAIHNELAVASAR